jgi:hypothetical protein
MPLLKLENLHKHLVPKSENGTAATLNNIPIVTRIIPIRNHTGNSADWDNALISQHQTPMAPYIKQIPNRMIPEAKILSRNKYLLLFHVLMKRRNERTKTIYNFLVTV